MLLGYYRYRHAMTIEEYAQQVAHGELTDPTVSVQMKRGFQPRGIIRDYCEEPDSDNTAMLLVWENPEFELEY
jgi:hypothetical protein